MPRVFAITSFIALAAASPLIAQQANPGVMQPRATVSELPMNAPTSIPVSAPAPAAANARATFIARLVDTGFPAYDADKSGGLTQPEFAQWVLALYATAEAANVATRMDSKAKAIYAKNAFATADTDKSKNVSKSEIYSFLVG